MDCLGGTSFLEACAISPLVISLCSPERLQSCSPSSGTSSSLSSTTSPCTPLRLTPTVSIVASSTCSALILSPFRLDRFVEDRKFLYRRSKRQLMNAKSSARFQVDENMNLGEGGFGRVFRSEYNHQDVAIKQLHYKRHSVTSNMFTLRAELNAFRLPPSPFVVSIFSFTACGPNFQVVSEFVSGRDLRKLIDDEECTFDCETRKRIAFQVASGLAHCHKHGVLHLDVKPSNVIVGDGGRPCKLSDFGCSRVAVSNADGTLRVENSPTLGTNFGTVAYRAPELLKGEAASDRADVYSFGLLLYELLSRDAPFPLMHPHTIVFLVVSRGARPDVATLRANPSRYGLTAADLRVADIAEKCWSAEPLDRPDAQHVALSIRNVSVT